MGWGRDGEENLQYSLKATDKHFFFFLLSPISNFPPGKEFDILFV